MEKTLNLPDQLGPGLSAWARLRAGEPADCDDDEFGGPVAVKPDDRPVFIEQSESDVENQNDESVEATDAIADEALRREFLARMLSGNPEIVQVRVKPGVVRYMPAVMGHPLGTKVPGPVRSDVMVLGKCLGQEEQNLRYVFAGPSGNLFREICRTHNIDCSSWYATNVLKTIHPDEGNGWDAAWVSEWLPILRAEMAVVRPKFLLCLGSEAIKAVLGKGESLRKTEGRVFEVRYPVGDGPDGPEYETCLMMGAVHPAAILRKPQFRSQLIRELTRFGQLVRGVRWDMAEPGIDHRVVLDMDGLLDLEQEIERDCQDNLIAIDAEWQGDHPENPDGGLVSVQLSWRDKTSACVGLRTAGVRQRFEGGTIQAALRVILRILTGRQVAGHFVVADLEWLDAELGETGFSDLFRVPESAEAFRDAAVSGKPCGFDTAYAMCAVEETAELSLKSMALRLTDAPRYDTALREWLDAEQARRAAQRSRIRRAVRKRKALEKKTLAAGKSLDDLPPVEALSEEEQSLLSDNEDDVGFGLVPDDIRDPYANYDADVTRRIAVRLMKMLDFDEFGQPCWKPFWITMRALPGILEINRTGIRVSRDRLDRLVLTYMGAKKRILTSLRETLRWPEFNPDSAFEAREALFGEKYNKKVEKGADPTAVVRLRPPGALSLYMNPVLTTDKRAMLWSDVRQRGLEHEKTASTKGMVLAILSHNPFRRTVSQSGRVKKLDCRLPIELFRSYKVVSQTLRSSLRPPMLDEQQEMRRRSDGWLMYAKSSKAIPGSICADGRVRTHIYPTKETGRWSSSRAPLHNISKRREADYQRILKDDYPYPLRSMLEASPGHLLVEADYIGAELFGMAVMACDEAMIRDATRNQLPETDPDFYDIHSNIAVQAFRLDCEPTKAGLDSIGKKFLRDIAKAVIFGVAYGRQAKAISISAREQGVAVTEEDAEQIRKAIFARYPKLDAFFAACRSRASCERFIVGCMGRRRRAPYTNDHSQIGDTEREFMNFPIQGLIADVVSRAVDHIVGLRVANGMRFRIVLQIHDALLFEVPLAEVEQFVDVVLPEGMRNRVPIYPATLGGEPTGLGPYHLGLDSNVYRNWGIQMYPEQLLALGVVPRMAGWLDHPSGGWSHPGKTGKIWLAGGWKSTKEVAGVRQD